MLLHVIVLVSFISDSGQACNETARPLDRMDTRSGKSVIDYNKNNDVMLREGWYTTMYNGLQLLIADSNHLPDFFACGTILPYYLNGTHPSLKSITEEPDVFSVCNRGSTHCNKVEIRNCSGQIQYYLSPTEEFAGYCFELCAEILPQDAGECPMGTTTAPNSTTTITTTTATTTTSMATTTENVGTISISTDLQFKQELKSTIRQDIIPYILFRCLFLKASGRFYTVSWFVDENLLMTVGPSGNETDFLLHEDTLLTFSAGQSLHGKQLSCSVSLHDRTDKKKIVSSAKSGILKIAAEVNTNPVVLFKNGTTTIDIEFTLPIGCGYAIINNEKPSFPCDYSLKLFMKNGWKCRACGIANIVNHPTSNNFCTQPLKMLETSSQWNQTTFKHALTISTIDYNYDDADKYFLELKFDDSIAHKLWKNYTFPDIQVVITDTKLYQKKLCYSRVDPHMKTADNSYYEQQRTGYFMLYYNLKYKIEVQVQVEQCHSRWNSHPKCACAIAVRAGKDVFMINSCGSVYFLGFTSCGDGGIIDVIDTGTRKFKIFTPIGTQILVDMLSGTFTGKLNIEIIMAPKDEHNVLGHCGKFDGNTLNEFTHKNGGFTKNLPYTRQDPQTFSDSWRLSVGENLFLSSDRKLESWNEINHKYCICKRPGVSLFETTCSYSQFLGCTHFNGKVLRKCQPVSRVKRSTSIREEIERRRMFTLFSQQRTVREKRQVTNNIGSDEASSLCASLKQSLPLTELVDFSGNESAEAVTSQCEFDVVELNDASFINVHLDAMNGVVKTMLALSPLFVSNNTETVSYFIANSCSMNCSGNGICMANGTCACNGTFRGSDCSIDITQPLTIDDIEGGGVCDIAEGDCQCFTMRTNNLLDNFYCEVDVYQVISYDTNAEKVWSESNAGRYEDLFTGVCCVSYEQLKRTTAYALKYGFAFSNDGLNYGASKTTYVYDSTCEYVNSTSSGELVFSMKDNYCFIGGSCVEANQTDSADECLVCHPENNVLSWTRVCTDTEADSKNSNNVVLVIVTTSTAVIGLLVIGLAVILLWKFCLKQKINPNSQPDETEPEMATAISRLPVANTAWSRVRYASKPFNQPEKNPFNLPSEHLSSDQSNTSKGLKWSTISVSSRPSTAASIPVSREARKETSGFFKQNLKQETDVNEGPSQKEELTRGVSVINLEFDYGNEYQP